MKKLVFLCVLFCACAPIQEPSELDASKDTVDVCGSSQALCTGTQGASGEQGPKGDTGPMGVQGPQGLMGSQGEQGVTGSQGLQGLPGANGFDGELGPQGPAGPRGIQGPQGVSGSTGPEGKPGKDGKDATFEASKLYKVIASGGSTTSSVVVSARCEEGDLLIGGGCAVSSTNPDTVLRLVSSSPDILQTGESDQVWQCQWTKTVTNGVGFTAIAMCLKP